MCFTNVFPQCVSPSHQAIDLKASTTKAGLATTMLTETQAR